MKNTLHINILDQKRFSTHLVLLIMSFLAFGIAILSRPSGLSNGDIYDALILIFVQVEIFIFFAGFIFKPFRITGNRKDFTKIILSRFALFMVICFIASFVVMIAFISLKGLIKGWELPAAISNSLRHGFKGWLKSTLIGLSAGAVIFLFFQWQDALRREQKLFAENLIFQNETLKSQVNPHFLFNSLNTISALIQTQPEAAERFINNLSSVYRYILENGQKDQVSLKSELEFAIEYFNLYQVRDEEKIDLPVEAAGAEQFKILPVSLQILIENAIKHNIATRENRLKIMIYIEGEAIVVKNNLQRKATQLKSMGVGLKNLSERTKIVSGRDVVINETNSEFIVKLPLLK